MSKKSGAPLLYFILTLSALLPYSRITTLGFTNFDDPGYVTQNAHVREGITREGILWALTSLEEYNWHPWTWLSHMADVQLYDMNPTGHHLTSLLLHLATTLLLFSVFRRATGAPGRSAMVAALFAVHPLHVESVAWVAERKDVLSALFWMLTLQAYLGYAETRRATDYLRVVLWLALGLASKPMLVTLPLVLLLLDFWPLQRVKRAGHADAAKVGPGGPGKASPWRLVGEKLPLLLLSAASSAVTYGAQQAGGSVVSFEKLDLGTRVTNALFSYVWYLEKTLWPSHLAAFYPRYGQTEWWQVGAALLFLGAITWLAVRFFAARPYLLIGWLWYLGTLVPVIGLVQVGDQAMADRYSYIPLIGVFLMLVWAGADAMARARWRPQAVAATAGVVVCALGIVAFRQAAYWKDSLSLFRHAIDVTGDNELAYLNFGSALAAEGKLDEAATLYEGVLDRKPDLADLQANYGTILALQGKGAEAKEHFAAALNIDPDQPEAHNGLGLVLAREGKVDEAVGHYRAALRGKPEYPEAQYNLGVALMAQGRSDLALAQFEEAVRIRPAFTDAHEKLASLLASRGKPDEAVIHYLRVVQARPGDAQVRYALGLALYQTGRSGEALTQLREATRLKPDQPDVLNTLAWVLATAADVTSEDAAQSVDLAQRALTIAGQPNAAFLDTLAAAFAAAGRYQDALRTADEAARLAAAAGDQALLRDLDARRQLYSAGRRHKEPPR